MSGKISFFSSAFTDLCILGRLRETGLIPLTIPPLGSVGVAAVYLSRILTDAPVFFSGLDFSYMPGKTHARGAPSLMDQHATSTRTNPWALFGRTMRRPLLALPGKGGSPIRSDVVLAGYRNLLAILLTEDKRVFDLGRTGLPTGAPCVTHDQTLRMCRDLAGNTARRASFDQGERLPTGEALETRIESFLAAEVAILESFLRGITERRDEEPPGSDTGGERTDHQKQDSPPEWMLPADYVWVHFPDAHRADYRSLSFRRRAEASARRYLALIGRAQHLCRELMESDGG
jgi:hypothetical protein